MTLGAGARRSLRERGRDPFNEYQVPQAVTLFRQGFGRLIRTRTDWGIVAILDPRVVTKRYGATFLRSLPSCTVATELEAIEEFAHRFDGVDEELSTSKKAANKSHELSDKNSRLDTDVDAL
jgi:Rad3-related DNA helicase